MSQQPSPLDRALGVFDYSLPTHYVFGPGRLKELPRLVDELAGPQAKVLLVTGQTSLRASGVLGQVCRSLDSHRITLFDQVPTNPSPGVAEQALQTCRQQECNLVVAIGGGSSLDVGKMTALLAPQSGELMAYLEGQIAVESRGLPCIAVPTTSGSSSEVTPFTVTWDKAAGRRYPLVHPWLFPSAAIVDPELATSMSASLAAVTGMDAFTSAFEAYWSVQSHHISDLLALECIRLYVENLESSCLTASPQARASCALAASLSGMAYSSARTTGPHAFGTPLSIYFGAVHGAAVGITLPAFLHWNAPTLDGKLEPLLDAIGCLSLEVASQRLTSLMQRCGLHTRLQEMGVGLPDLPRIVRRALSEPQMRFNPRTMTEDQGVAFLQDIL